jgi:uncharacterized protein YjbJ (UPF0337 family)
MSSLLGPVLLNCKNSGGFMNEDTLKGKAKDVAGRVERQVGEWTGDEESQAKGAAKQAEGKVQNAFGKAKDAVNDKLNDSSRDKKDDRELDDEDRRKTA